MKSVTTHRIYRVTWTARRCVVISAVTGAPVATWTEESGWVDAGRLPDDIRAHADGVKPTSWKCKTCSREGFSYPMPYACLGCGSERDAAHGPHVKLEAR